jgi:hypothetical protein
LGKRDKRLKRILEKRRWRSQNLTKTQKTNQNKYISCRVLKIYEYHKEQKI